MLPQSPSLREHFAAERINVAAYLDLYSGNTGFAQALGLPNSMLQAYLHSEAFKNHAKNREALQKLELAKMGRMDSILRAMGGLGKLLARR